MKKLDPKNIKSPASKLINRKPMGTSCSNENWVKLRQLSEITDISLAKLCDRALVLLFEKHKDDFEEAGL